MRMPRSSWTERRAPVCRKRLDEQWAITVERLGPGYMSQAPLGAWGGRKGFYVCFDAAARLQGGLAKACGMAGRS